MPVACDMVSYGRGEEERTEKDTDRWPSAPRGTVAIVSAYEWCHAGLDNQGVGGLGRSRRIGVRTGAGSMERRETHRRIDGIWCATVAAAGKRADSSRGVVTAGATGGGGLSLVVCRSASRRRYGVCGMVDAAARQFGLACSCAVRRCRQQLACTGDCRLDGYWPRRLPPPG